MKKEEVEKKLDELHKIKEGLETEEGLLQSLIVHGGLKLDNALRTLSIEIESVEDDITYHERQLNKIPMSEALNVLVERYIEKIDASELEEMLLVGNRGMHDWSPGEVEDALESIFKKTFKVYYD